MSYLTIDNINNWLAETKYSVVEVNSDMEAMAVGTVMGALDVRYDITTWLNSATTPPLVVSVLGMLVAAWEYDRATSEDDGDGLNYAARLERRAMALLNSISTGAMELPGAVVDTEVTAAGFPTDNSTSLALEDPTNPDASPMVFSSGMSF